MIYSSFVSIRSGVPLRLRAPLLALIGLAVAAVWYGYQAWAAQAAIRVSSPFTFNVARFGLGGFVMLLVCLGTHRWPTRKEWCGGLLMGVIAAAMYACDSFSLFYDPAGRASFLGGLYVVIMPLGAWLVFRRRQAVITLIGCVVVVGGAFLLWYTPGGTLTGDFFALLRAFVFVGLMATTRQVGRADFRFVMLIELSVVCLVSSFGAVATHHPVLESSWTIWISALVCGVGGSVVCGALDLWACSRLPVALAGVMVFAETPATVIWGLLAGQTASATSMLPGFGLITLGTVAVITGDLVQKPLRYLVQRLFIVSGLPIKHAQGDCRL